MADADLILRGGRVLDVDTGRWTTADVGVRQGRIVDLPPAATGRTEIDVRGHLVVPGLTDLHTHVYRNVTAIGADVEDVTFCGGVTTIADAGSCGAETFPGFREWIAGPARARVLCFVNFSRLGLVGSAAAGELADARYADPDGVAAILAEHPDVAVGIKVRVSASMTGGPCMTLLREAGAVARALRRPLLVHIGDSVEPISEIVAALSPGDIVTHFQTPKANGLLDKSGRLHPAVGEARARGVLFDSGHGRTHFDFDTARRLLDLGFPPDTLSSDISRTSLPELTPGLLTVVNKWLALGLPLTDALLASTLRPAEALAAEPAWGRLTAGRDADIAVLTEEQGPFTYRDAAGRTAIAPTRLARLLTIRLGKIAWPAPKEVLTQA